jgi:hypothetical protein
MVPNVGGFGVFAILASSGTVVDAIGGLALSNSDAILDACSSGSGEIPIESAGVFSLQKATRMQE